MALSCATSSTSATTASAAQSPAKQSLLQSLLAQLKSLEAELAALTSSTTATQATTTEPVLIIPAPSTSGGGSGGSGSPPTTPIPAPAASCVFNNLALASGASVIAYQTAMVPYGAQCASQSRTCQNGTLSGSYQYASCAVGQFPTVTAGTCHSGSGWCLEVSYSGSSASAEIVVSPTGKPCDSTMTESTPSLLENIGTHGGGPLPQYSALYCEPGQNHTLAALSIVDLNTNSVVATTKSPDRSNVGGVYPGASWTDYPKDPQGNEYPFLAAGYGDTLDPSGDPIWGYLCLYKPGTTQTTGPAGQQCGANFMFISTAPTGSYFGAFNPSYYFREVGGYLEDLDADGWDDISLIFHSLIYTVSGKTGQPLATTVYDIASSTNTTYVSPEPNSPEWFHSGRNYGIHTVDVGSDGTIRTVMIGGVPIGTFYDANCNVSRFVGVLASTPNNPAGRTLAWSRYFGFGSNNYYGPFTVASSTPWVTRPGDAVNGCIHRFSDGISLMGSTPIVIFNYFTAADTSHYTQLGGSPEPDPTVPCDIEQFTYYMPGNDGSEWYACLAAEVKQRGTWGMQVLRLSDGEPLTGSLKTYIWGMSNKLLPSGEVMYLTQVLPPQENFDLSDVSGEPHLQVLALDAQGSWKYYNQFPLPIAGLPVIQNVVARDTEGVGSYTGYDELITKDIDGDGLQDVEICANESPSAVFTAGGALAPCPSQDVVWVGYNQSTGTFVVK
jgi:hypothetical protein